MFRMQLLLEESNENTLYLYSEWFLSIFRMQLLFKKTNEEENNSYQGQETKFTPGSRPTLHPAIVFYVFRAFQTIAFSFLALLMIF